jgi:hypothetical protein
VQFVLEVVFLNRDDYKRARKALKKIAGGDDYAKALLALLDG